MSTTVLQGHTSPETALVIDNYPYGFRLRTKIRYWLEFKKGKGFRFCSQTLNPKVSYEKWNAPKKSTYIRFGGVMLEDDSNGYISWTGIGAYDDLEKLEAFRRNYGDILKEDFPESLPELDHFIDLKRTYEAKLAEGKDFRIAAKIAVATHADYDIEEVKNGK